MQCSNIRYSKQWYRKYNILNRKDVRCSNLRSLGYYKIKQGILQNLNLSKYYRFEWADILFEYFSKFINILKKEREQKES